MGRKAVEVNDQENRVLERVQKIGLGFFGQSSAQMLRRRGAGNPRAGDSVPLPEFNLDFSKVAQAGCGNENPQVKLLSACPCITDKMTQSYSTCGRQYPSKPLTLNQQLDPNPPDFTKVRRVSLPFLHPSLFQNLEFKQINLGFRV